MELYTDTYYIKRIQEGDTACFACLLDRHSRPVHALILRLVENREDAEELTQDVFMKVFKSLSGFQGDSSFSTWLYRIAYNTAISHVRKKKLLFVSIEDSHLGCNPEDMDTEDSPNLNARVEQLEWALTCLSPEDRALVLLFYMKEKRVDEIALITGLSESNVKTKLFRIRKKLYVLIKEKMGVYEQIR